MMENDLISEELWDETAARHDLLRVGLQLAEAELRVFESGARPEDIAAAQVEVEACESELEQVRSMLVAQDIRTPVAGSLRLGGDEITLLSVVRLDTVVVRILVPQRFGALAHEGQPFRAFIPGTGARHLDGTITRIDRRTLPTAAGPFMMAYGLVDNASAELAEGMEGRSRIMCGKTTLLAQLWYGVTRAWRREILPV